MTDQYASDSDEFTIPFNKFVLLKGTKRLPQSTLDEILSQNDLYKKISDSDIDNLPEINLDNFVNICNFVDYYILIDDRMFITNIQYLILRGYTKVINNIHLISPQMYQKICALECFTEAKCIHNQKQKNIKHVACYMYFDKDNDVNYSIDEACRDGNLDVVKYLLTSHRENTKKCINFASYSGNLDLIKYLFEIGLNCTTDAIDNASLNGHLEVIKYLFEVQRKDCTIKAINVASLRGHLEVLKYLLEDQHQKCARDTIEHAICGGHLEIVKYLFEIQHQKSTIKAINGASRYGRLEVVKYLIEIKHQKYAQETINLATIYKHNEIIAYLKSKPDFFIE